MMTVLLPVSSCEGLIEPAIRPSRSCEGKNRRRGEKNVNAVTWSSRFNIMFKLFKAAWPDNVAVQVFRNLSHASFQQAIDPYCCSYKLLWKFQPESNHSRACRHLGFFELSFLWSLVFTSNARTSTETSARFHRKNRALKQEQQEPKNSTFWLAEDIIQGQHRLYKCTGVENIFVFM